MCTNKYEHGKKKEKKYAHSILSEKKQVAEKNVAFIFESDKRWLKTIFLNIDIFLLNVTIIKASLVQMGKS